MRMRGDVLHWRILGGSDGFLLANLCRSSRYLVQEGLGFYSLELTGGCEMINKRWWICVIDGEMFLLLVNMGRNEDYLVFYIPIEANKNCKHLLTRS